MYICSDYTVKEPFLCEMLARRGIRPVPHTNRKAEPLTELSTELI